MATCTSVGSGNWATAGTWDTAPGDGDTVIIAAGHTVTFDANQSAYTTGLASLTIQNGATFTLATNPNSEKSVSSITRSSTTATVNCTAHGYTAGDEVWIAGASQTGYNGRYTVATASTDSFTISVHSELTTPATGTITVRKVAHYYLKMAGNITGTNTSGHLGTFSVGNSTTAIPLHTRFTLDTTGSESITAFRQITGGSNKTLKLELACTDPAMYFLRGSANVAVSDTTVSFASADVSTWQVGDRILFLDVARKSTYSATEFRTIVYKTDTGFTVDSGFTYSKTAGFYMLNTSRNVRIINVGGNATTGNVPLLRYLPDTSFIRSEMTLWSDSSARSDLIMDANACTIGGVWCNVALNFGLFHVRGGCNNLRIDKLVWAGKSNGLIYYSYDRGVITDSFFCGCSSTMLTGRCLTVQNCRFLVGDGSTLNMIGGTSTFRNCYFEGLTQLGTSASNPVFYTAGTADFYNCTFENNNYAVGRGADSTNMYNCTLQNNTRDISQNTLGRIKLVNCIVNSSTQWESYGALSTSRAPYALTTSYDHGQVVGAFKAWSMGGIVTSDATAIDNFSWSYKWALSSSTEYTITEHLIVPRDGQQVEVIVYAKQSVTGMTERLRVELFTLENDPWIVASPTYLGNWQIPENTELNKCVFRFKSTQASPMILRLYAKNASGNVYHNYRIREEPATIASTMMYAE